LKIYEPLLVSISRLSRRLEVRERARTGAAPKPEVRGLEDQVA
jgi:hypothetical protein